LLRLLESQREGRKYKMLRFLDAGESHGKCLLGIIEGKKKKNPNLNKFKSGVKFQEISSG